MYDSWFMFTVSLSRQQIMYLVSLVEQDKGESNKLFQKNVIEQLKTAKEGG